MKKKIISILILLLIIGAFITNHLITYARVAETSLYVKLSSTDLNGVGYGNGNPNPDVGGTSEQGEYIWNLMTYDSTDSNSISTVQRNLYCVKADYGQTWFTEQKDEEILEYNLTYDMQTDRETLLANLKNNGNDADDVIRALLNPEGSQYRQLLWLLDNAYTSGTDLNEYLAKVGIFSGEYEGNTYYYKVDNGLKVEYPNGDPLTEADIIAIQRMAIWYFTNGENYDKTAEDLWLFMTSNGTNYNQLKTLSKSRNAMAMDLYQYLITGAQNGASQYTEENGYKVNGVPANVNTTGLTQENGKYVIKATRAGDRHLIGPIVINKNNDLGYDIEILVSDQDNNPLANNTDYIYTDKDGKKLENITSDKDLVDITEGFYISVPRSKVENVNIKVTIEYKNTTKKLWLQGTEDKNGIKLDAEQPLVEVTQDPQKLIVELTSKTEEFDLALRKYIVALYDKNGTEKTIPNARKLNNIFLDTLLTGTTATYKHRKDPVVVVDGDEVAYQIRIYNEGNKAGYATEIIDQLPVGLIRSTNTTSTITSKDKVGNVKNTYTVSYNTTTNRIILKIVDTAEKPAQSLQPYTLSGELDYEIIEIRCKVAQKADTKNQITLTNVAWINEAYNVEDDKIIKTTVGDDRDSEPGNAPKVLKDNMEEYKGNTKNLNDLSNSEYFYEGQQDDDDFEKVVIMPVEKVFDLALFKHIAAVSKDQTIEEGEYITDTKRSDGTYLRAPVVKSIDPDTGKITYEQDAKDALAVESGDYVLYTIRVYNEGEIDGYASKIKDTLPIGLEFVVENEEYNGIWNLEGLDTDGRQVVTTTWYAKGQGAELNTVEGDANYRANLLKALNKEDAISNENPDYIDAQILCRVVEETTSNRVMVNYAQISDDSDENGDQIDDVDSTPDKWIDTDDDQDIERIQLQYFDLSLRKFITIINGTDLKGENGKYIREPVVDTSNLVNGTGTTAVYTHPKEPIVVHVGDEVIYTIRVYNEGNVKGYASEVTDDIPEYLEYLPENSTNVEYMWKMYDENGNETKDVAKAVKVKTIYLSKENGEDNLIKEFDGTTLYYKDIKIAFKVKDPNSNTIVITNHAQISDDRDENNDPVKDKDSEPDKWNKGEDDQDIENIKVEYFDLSLLKFVSKVIIIEDGKETITETGYNGHEDPEPVVKVELHKKKLNKVTVKFGYGITITNEGDIPGYATEIKDYIPEGLKFNPNDNPEWTDEGNNVISTRQLQNVLLQPGESRTIEVMFTWINGKDNLALKTNTAEISEDKNEYDVPDKDSTPDNKKDGEDDIDIAKVILAVSTGATKTYFTLTLGLLAIIATGVFLIKRFVI